MFLCEGTCPLPTVKDWTTWPWGQTSCREEEDGIRCRGSETEGGSGSLVIPREGIGLRKKRDGFCSLDLY